MQLESAKALHKTLFVPLLTHDSETLIWKEKEKSRIKVAHIDTPIGFLSIKKVDKRVV